MAGALYVARKAGFDDILTFDMGGTSTDVALCQNGQPTIGRETSIGHFRIKVPSVNVHTVGAGGGSIAHVPELTKALRVGPQSAGAEPGPAAYGKGGDEPTVTDANVVLGHLPPAAARAARWSSTSTLRARPSRRSRTRWASTRSRQAAEGIVAIVNENMAGALRLVSVQRGHDPRDFALVAYGGAGPLHANAVAKLMGSFPVLVPPAPGLLCAIGDLVADFRDEFAQTYIRVARRRRPARRSRAILDEPRRARDGVARRRGHRAGRARHLLRRRHALPPAGLRDPGGDRPRRGARDGLADLEERFNGLHEQLYGFRMPGTAVGDRQPARGRLRRRAEAGPADRRARLGATPSGAVVDEHEIVFEGEQRRDEDLRPGEARARDALRRARRS